MTTAAFLDVDATHTRVADTDVWRFRLDERFAAECEALLSDDERGRAARFLQAAARTRFVVARAHVRTILAGVIGSSPMDLRFSYGPRGKPFVASRPNIHFNVSRSGDEAVCAVRLGAAVGIDLEVVRPGAVDLGAAALVLSAAELAFIDRARDPDRAALLCWVRKEAFAKVTGRGLERDLTDRTVTTAAGGVAVLAGCELSDIEDGPGVVLALARATDERADAHRNRWGARQ